MAKRRPKRRKARTLTQRVTALENMIKPKRARASKKSSHAVTATSEPQYLGAYRIS